MLVIDTSIAVKWVIAPSGNDLEEDSGEALALLPHGLIAPDLMLTEFANALWKKVRRNEIDRDQATESLKIFPTLVNFLPSRKFANDALRLSLELDHPVYDCVFLAVAELNRLQLVSADRKFVKHIRQMHQLKLALEACGVHVDIRTTRDPGHIIWQDEHQLVAEPGARKF